MIRAFEPDIDGKRIIVKSVVASALLLNVLSGLNLHRCRMLLNYRYGLVLIWILVVGAERESERERVWIMMTVRLMERQRAFCATKRVAA